MQLSLDAADRLVELVEEGHGMVSASEAARSLFALGHVSDGLATQLLADVVGSDSRLAWRGSHVALTSAHPTVWSLDTAPYVVFDLETTGLSPGASRICEIGAVRLRGLVPTGSFTTLVDPGVPLPRNIAALTGLADEALRTAPAVQDAVGRFLAFAGDCVLVAHNARFDLAFLHREVERLTGRRLAAPVLDTVWLARRLLAGRTPRASLASLAHFFGTSVTPCHRALPDAQATAEILVRLIGIAQEQGAQTIEDLCQLAAPRARRIHGKRSLAFGAPTRPGVYLFRDRTEQVLYVGRARDLRARLRSYFRSERQRPAVEAALGAAHRIEWRVLGSELEAALEELRLIRELRPPANARGPRPERYVYFERRGDRVTVSSRPTELGPIKGRSRAARAARALAGASDAELDRLTADGPLPRLRARLRDLSESLRYEEAARLRDRISALESVMQELARLERLRAAELCLLVPAREAGFRRLFVLAGGRIAATRTLPAGGGLTLELEAALSEARAAAPSIPAEDADELLLLGTFLKRPPPELTIIPSTAVTREAKRLSAVPALA